MRSGCFSGSGRAPPDPPPPHRRGCNNMQMQRMGSVPILCISVNVIIDTKFKVSADEKTLTLSVNGPSETYHSYTVTFKEAIFQVYTQTFASTFELLRCILFLFSLLIVRIFRHYGSINNF